MARYKHTDIEEGQGLFLTVNLKEQIVPGTFEYMLNDLVENEIDIKMFDENYKNDETGSKAIPPAILIKLIVYGYSKGVKSSRKLMELGKRNMIAKALTEDMEPHWTTIADFVSRNEEKFQKIFVEVMMYCDGLGLIGGETFAVDGLRLPSNASIDMSGTEEELKKRVEIYQRMAKKHVKKHLKQDEQGEEDKDEKRRYEERQKYLRRQIEKMRGFLKNMERREGKRVQEIKSNVTDNESAMIMSSSGFLQGYIGIAVSDKQNQIILNAEAVGSANEGEHLPELLDKTLSNIKEAGVKISKKKKPKIMGDANYFSEENLRACKERGLEAIIPDSQYNRRLGVDNERRYEAADFEYHKKGNYYECPCGKRLEYKYGRKSVIGGQDGMVYQASVKDCRPCPLNGRCLRTKKDPSRWVGRQLLITKSNEPDSLCGEMRKKLSTEEYQNFYSYRIQIIEPVFANIKNCKGLNRFTLRGKNKVNAQWKLYCIVHNLGKCLNGYNKIRDFA